MTDFRTFVEDQFHAMAWQYRVNLEQTIDLFLHYMNGYAITESAREICIEALRAVRLPGISRYDGEVSEADRAWYMGCRKPQWSEILAEYEGRVKQLTAPATDTRK